MQSRLVSASRSSLRSVLVTRFPFVRSAYMSAPAQAPSSGASSALRPGAAVVDDDVDSLSSQLSSMGIAPAAGSSRHRESRGPRSGGTGAVAGVGVGAGVVSSPHRTPRVCRYFHSGRCSYGNKCRDLHTEPPATVGSAPQELKQEQQQIAPPGSVFVPHTAVACESHRGRGFHSFAVSLACCIVLLLQWRSPAPVVR